jgi:hypothetical protein
LTLENYGLARMELGLIAETLLQVADAAYTNLSGAMSIAAAINSGGNALYP